MAVQPKVVQKPFRNFRKILKDFSKPPTPEQVHSLRTQARHLEAVVRAWQLEEHAGGSALLKALKPLRKQAGEVREMDVLIGFVSTLERDAEDQGLTELIEYLADRRKKAAQKLSKTVAAREQKTLKQLNRCLKLVQGGTGSSDANAQNGWQISTKPTARALQLQTELGGWPRLTAGNIHPYRLELKELRYVLQLSQSGESKLGTALAEAKEQIGAWHDWSQLALIARKCLRGSSNRKLFKQFRVRARQEFGKALELANALQSRYFSGEAAQVAARKAPVREFRTSAIKEVSRLAG